MRLCHGKGNLETDGCCWVNGAICPLRWKIENGNVYDHTGTNLGAVATLVTSKFKGKASRDVATAQLSGPVIVCSAAVEVLANNTNLANNRAGFNDAWNNHAEYVTKVRPHWATLEQQLGLAAGSYQCSTWQGTGGDQCCFAEDEATNASKRQNLSSTAVTIRQAGGKP